MLKAISKLLIQSHKYWLTTREKNSRAQRRLKVKIHQIKKLGISKWARTGHGLGTEPF
jgi:hypothetical protein